MKNDGFLVKKSSFNTNPILTGWEGNTNPILTGWEGNTRKY